MNENVKIPSSAILILSRILAAIFLVGFIVTTAIGVIDFRTEKQKENEQREYIVNHSLFSVAEKFAKDILEDSGSVDSLEKISCVEVKAGEKFKKVVLIEYKNTKKKCYVSVAGDLYASTTEDMYSKYKEVGLKKAELVLMGDDLNILFEEAAKE